MGMELTPHKPELTTFSRSAPLIERAPLPIIEVQGSSHTVSYVNSAFCRLLGKSKEALIGKSFVEIVHGGDQCIPLLDSVYHTGEATTHVLMDESSPAPASWLYAMWPALDAEEQPVGVIIQLAKTTGMHDRTVAVNEALLIAGLRQHELVDEAKKLSTQLQAEITERKQGDDARAILAAIVESSEDAILSKDLNGIIATWNRGAERLFGYSAEEAIGQSIAMLFPADKLGELEDILTCVRSGNSLKPYETVRRHKDGTMVEVALGISPILDVNGKIVGASKIVRNISDRRKAEEVQALLGAIVSSAEDGILSKKLDGVVTTWNASAERLFGYTAEEIIGNPNIHLTPPELQHEEEVILESILAGEAIEHYETKRLTKNGRRLQVSLTISPIMDAKGTVIGASKIVRDITERKQVEESLRESVERFRVSALAVNDLIWTNNAQGMMEGEQPGWANFTGQTIEEYQGHGWARVVHPDDAQPTIEAWNAAVAEKRLFEFEHRVCRHDGAWRTCLVRAVPVFDRHGEIREWVGVHNDITERKQTSAALITAKEDAEAASRSKDNFLAALSHELRTPLTPVLMMATALAGDSSLPPETREQLDMMRRNIELEARLIDDLLDFSRILHSKFSMERVTTDIHDLLNHTEEFIRSDGFGKKLQVRLNPAAARHHALADPTRLQQVFWNLLRNAVKFSPDGSSIIVSTYNDAEGKIFVSVADEGIGIRAEMLPQIFNAFEQGDASGEHRYGGLGLGLAISSAIITAHGGQLRAASDGLGHGSKFTVILESVPVPAAKKADIAAQTRPPRSHSLLIVEDHETTRNVLEKLLTLSGHKITTASTVNEALAAYNAAHFDAVVSDLGLPDGSGIDLMRQIQSIRPVPAIALSGYGMEGDLLRSKEAGFFAHLVKPVNMNQLRQLLAQIPDQAGQG